MAQLGVVSSASKNAWTFDPRTVSGCCLWLDGADSNTLFSNSAGTTPATVGGTVNYWKDKSLSANAAITNTSPYFPILGANYLKDSITGLGYLGFGYTYVTYTATNSSNNTVTVTSSVPLSVGQTFLFQSAYVGNIANLSGNISYYITSVSNVGTTYTLTLSTTSGGSTVTITSTVTGQSIPVIINGTCLALSTVSSLPTGTSNGTYFFVVQSNTTNLSDIFSYGSYGGYIARVFETSTTTYNTSTINDPGNVHNATVSNRNIYTTYFKNYENYTFVNGTIGSGGVQDLQVTAPGFNTGSSIGLIGTYIGGSPYSRQSLMNVYEIIFYNRAVLDTERQQIEGYLAQKWGISSSLPSTHPFKLSRPFSRQFVPTDVDTCILWLDAADRSTISLTGSYVTTWIDKSGGGNSGTNSSSTLTYTNTLNNLPVVSTGTSVLTPTITTLNPYNATYFIVFRPTVNYVGAIRPLNMFTNAGSIVTFVGTTGGSTTSSSSTYYMEINNNAYIGGYDFIQSIGSGNNTYLTNVPVVSCIQRAGSNYFATANGGLAFSYTSGLNTPPFLNSSGYYFTIGGGTGYDIAEIIVYNSAITQNERQKVEGYLMWKWGQQRSTSLSTPFTSAHPYYNFPPPSETLLQPPNIQYKTVFSPADLQPVVWLDAQDSSTYTTSSNRLTSWVSKGVGAFATATVTTVTPSSPSTGYVTYTLSNSASYGQPTSGFVVGQPVTISGITPSGYSVTATIYSTTGTTITIANSTTGTATLSSATAVVPLAFTPPSGISGPLVTTSGIGSGTGLTIMDFSNGGVFQISAGVVSTATTLTLTTTLAHGIPVGGVIILNLVRVTFAGGNLTSSVLNGIYTTQSGTTGSTVVITIPPSPNGTMTVYYAYLEYGVLPLIRTSVGNSYGTFTGTCATPHGLTASSSVIGINNIAYGYSDGAALTPSYAVNSTTNPTYTVQTTPTSNTFTTTLSTTSSNIQSITQNTGVSLGSISAIAFSSPTVTVTVSSTANIFIGFSVTITGTTSNNGTFIVTSVPSSTTFTILNSSGAAETPGSASATYSYTSCVVSSGTGFASSNYSVTISGATNTNNNGVFYIGTVSGNTIQYYNPNGVAQASASGTALTGIVNGNIGTIAIIAGYVAASGTTLYLYAPPNNFAFTTQTVAYLNITGKFNGGTAISLNGYYLIQNATSGNILVLTIPSSPAGTLSITNGYVDVASTQIISASISTTSTSVSALTASSPTSGYVTYTVSSSTGFVVGATVTITGVTPSGYNVTGATIVYVGSNTITIANATTGAASFSSATATLTGNTLSITTGYVSTPIYHGVPAYDYVNLNFGGSSKLSDGTTNASTLNGVYQVAAVPTSTTMILVLSTTYATGSLTGLSSSDILQLRKESYAMYPLNGYALESVSNTAAPLFSSTSLLTGIFVTHFPNLIITTAPSRTNNGGSNKQSKLLAGAYSAGGTGGADSTSGGRDFALQSANFAGPAPRYGIKHNGSALQALIYYNPYYTYTSPTSVNSGFQIHTFEFNMTASAIGDVPANTEGVAIGGWRYSNFPAGGNSVGTNSTQTNTSMSISHLRIGADTVATSTYSTYPLNGYFYEGQIGDILIFNGTLTLDQRQLLEGWISDKYGCRANLGSTTVTTGSSFIHPYNLNTVVPLYDSVSDSNLYVQGLAAWFDAANSSTIGFSSGSLVNSWASAGGFLSATLVPNGSNYPTLVSSAQNGLPGIRFTTAGNPLGSSFIYGITQVSTVSSNNEYTILTVYKNTSYTSGQAVTSIIGSAGNPRIQQYTNQISYRNTITEQVKNYTATTSGQAYIGCLYRRGNTMYMRINGTVDSGSTTSGTNLTIPTSIGNTFSISVGSYTVSAPTTASFGGDIYEHIIFRYALTDQQIQYIEGYLAWKWGLQNRLGILVSPLSIPGCSLWLDAADSSTISFSSGTNVSTWTDKSGQGNNATAVASGFASTVAPTYTASNKYVNFGGSSAMTTNLTASSTTETGFVVGSVTALATNTFLGGTVSGGFNTGGRQFRTSAGGTYGTLTYNNGGVASYASIAMNSPFAINTIGLLEYSINGGAPTLYEYGTLLGTGTSATLTASRVTVIGARGGATSYGEALTGNIYEVLVYNAALTTSQRQQVEGYLASKWGLQVNMPSTHPYYKLRP